MAESMFHNRPTGRPPQQCRRNTARHGSTFLELVAAMVVLGVALMGLFPLVVMQSRNLQPLRIVDPNNQVTYKSLSPARDWNKTDETLPVMMRRHTWYLTPYDDPWVRKLGAGALIASFPMTSVSPIPLSPSVLQQDDYDGTPNGDGDGTFSDPGMDFGWDYSPSASAALGGDQHRHEALPIGTTPCSLAAWTLTVTTTGLYSIQATWTESDDQADDAAYTVAKDGTAVPTVPSVNQRAAPVGVTDTNGRTWAPLTVGPVQLANGNSIQIQLSDVRASSSESGKYVVADGVRIVLQNDVKIKSIERSLSGTNSNSNNADLTVHVSVTVNLSQ